MKKLLYLFFFLAIILNFTINTYAKGADMSLTVNEKTESKVAQAELAGIMKAIGAYVQAAPDGDSDTAKKGFATWATMSYNENGKLVTVPIQALYDYFDEKKRPASGEIVACEVAGDVAMVRLESEFDGALFTDMFTLVKDGDSWKIVSKVYHVKN